jgi:hypothetical protein
MKRTAALLLVLAAAGCGSGTSPKEPPVSSQRDVAQRFARAIFTGRTAAAVSLLVHPADEGLSGTAAHVAARWHRQHAAVRLPGTHRGNHWTFRYAGTRTHPDGRFEQVRGDLVVVVADSRHGAAVEFFALLHETTRFGSHHDSVLLPSNR